MRGSRVGDKAVHLRSAYAGKARWVLTQQAGGEKTNEMAAIPDLLSMLDITGAPVSIDALGCQKSIAKTIIEAKADYLLALKDNHKDLGGDVRLWLDTEATAGHLPMHETVDKDHGRRDHDPQVPASAGRISSCRHGAGLIELSQNENRNIGESPM